MLAKLLNQGSYKLDADKLTLAPMAGTRIAGPPAQMAMEHAFGTRLATVDGYRIVGENLSLTAKGRGVARFQAGKIIRKELCCKTGPSARQAIPEDSPIVAGDGTGQIIWLFGSWC